MDHPSTQKVKKQDLAPYDPGGLTLKSWKKEATSQWGLSVPQPSASE